MSKRLYAANMLASASSLWKVGILVAVFAVVMVLGITTKSAVLLPTGVAYAAPSITVEEIDSYLRKKHSPLAGLGQVFIDKGREYGVDPRLVIAIAGAETNFGTELCADYNAWNWFYKDTTKCSANAFSSWDEGVESVTRGLRRSYLDKGLTTIPKIAEKYTVTEREDWIRNVTFFYQTDLHGYVNDLSYTPLPSPEEVIRRAESEAPKFRPYEYGVHDCWLYVKHMWRPWKDLSIYDGGKHNEDWTEITSPDQLIPGDVLATAQGHRWGRDWHGGIYAGKDSKGNHWQWDCTRDQHGNGAYKRPFNYGFTYYNTVVHQMLKDSTLPIPPPAPPSPSPTPIEWLREQIEKLKQQLQDEWDRLSQRIGEEIEKQIERLERELQRRIGEELEKKLSEICGGPAALLLALVIFLVRRRT